MFSKNKLFSRGAVVLLAGMIASHAHAEVDALVTDARALLDQSQAQKAFDLLEPQEPARAGDPDFDTVLGIACIETGQYTRAVFALERVLAVQPGNSRARAELGRALFSVGDTKASRQVLMETKRDDIPAEAAATIDQFLQVIDQAEESARSSVQTYLEASIGHDTNINAGPGNPNVAVPAFGGLIFTLSPAGVETNDAFVTMGGGLTAKYVVDPRWSLLANASGNARVNAKYNDFNTGQVDVNVGASYRYEKHQFTGAVQAGTYTIAGSRARDQQGLVGSWTYRPDGFRQWNTYIQWGDLIYPGQSLRDATRTVIGTSYAHTFRDSDVIAFAGAYLGTEKERASGVPHLGHDLFGLRVGGQKTLSDEWALFGSVSYEDRKYGGTDPLFLVTRQDKQWGLNLGVNWVPAKLWRVTPQLALTSVKSNIAISDYNRSMFSVTVRRDF
jgi:tetratricopeptide (TPR) repeat protein